jgi:hypothetical protein
VDRDVLEAADAFGTSHAQKLFKVQLPLALPTIMAGINQTIMAALALRRDRSPEIVKAAPSPSFQIEEPGQIIL